MIKLNIHEAKTHLSRHLHRLERGESILLCRRNNPIAEIRLLDATRHTQRKIGLAKGTFHIPAAFFQPLPDDLLESFGGLDIEQPAHRRGQNSRSRK